MFVPASEPHISMYAPCELALALLTGLGAFYQQSIIEPGSRSARMPAAFFMRPLK
jgi:hypothetical protein